MPKHIWTVLCSKGIIDSATNQISIIDATECIFVALPDGGARDDSPTLVPMSLQLISLSMRNDVDTPEKSKARLLLIRPDNSSSKPVEIDIDLESSVRSRNIIGFSGVTVSTPGIYWFVLEYYNATTEEWECQARVPLEVQFLPEEELAKES